MNNLHNSITYISAIINNDKNDYQGKNYILTDKTMSRMKELGLDTFASVPHKEAKINLVQELENVVWKDAGEVKTPLLAMPKEKHLIKALNFLETFCIYACASNMLQTHVKDIPEGKFDTTVMKAVKGIEDINHLVKSSALKTTKTAKKTLKLDIIRVISLINKVFTSDLTLTQKNAFSKVVDKATGVLEKFSK